MANLYHTYNICLDIADKLKRPEEICEYIQEAAKQDRFITNQWLELSLAKGLPGIAVFYGVMDQIFPDQQWDLVVYAYLKLMIEKIEGEGISNISLFDGLSGICFATYLCSKEGFRYPKLLSKVDDLLFSEIEFSLFPQIDSYLVKELPFPPSLYNLSHGLCGVLAYLLLRKEHSTCYRLARDCLTRLILMLKQEQCINGYRIPGWYISQENQIAVQEKIKYPNGSFSLGMPYGVSGCLSILSLAFIEGIILPGQYEIIKDISNWLKSKLSMASSSPCWHHTVSFEEEISNKEALIDLNRDVWCYGTPAVSRTLYLASKATQDTHLMKFAENSFLTIFSKSWQERNMMGTTFDWGRAGLLALTYHMAKDTRNPSLLQQVDTLEYDLKRFYHPSHPFGFQAVQVTDSEQYRWINHPGLINGTVGIALSLLLNHFEAKMEWSKLFLLR